MIAIDVIDLRDGRDTDTPPAAVWVEPIDRDGQGHRIARLRSDDMDALHRFVIDAGLDDAGCAVGSVSTLTHYVLTPKQRRQAIGFGAEACDWSETYIRIAHATVIGTRPPESAKATRLGMRRATSFSTAPVVTSASATTMTKTAFRRSRLAALVPVVTEDRVAC